MFPIFHFHSVFPLLSHLCSLFVPHKAQGDTHRNTQEQKKNATNKSISLRRWWWNNYVETVLPVPSLHTKWLSGTINSNPCHQPQSLPPSLKLKVSRGSCSKGTFPHTRANCLYLIDVEWRVLFTMAVICQVLIIQSRKHKHTHTHKVRSRAVWTATSP